MEHSEHFPPSKSPETQPKIIHRDPLHLRMYFHRHLTALVRLIGHQEIPLAEAQEKLRPLVEQYGEELMGDAAEEILVIDRNRSPAVARLSDYARKLARPLIGQPPESHTQESQPLTANGTIHSQHQETTTAAPMGEDPVTAPAVTKAAPSTSSNVPVQALRTSRKPVSLPMREVRVHFENWLQKTGKNSVMVDAAKQAEFSDKRLATLDAIVYEENQYRLVTVRRTVSRLQIHDMLEWAKVFGADYQPYAVWPEKGSDGWVWEYRPIVSDSPDSSPAPRE